MIEELRLAVTQFLQIEIVSNPYIFISLWSVVHLISGFLVMFLLIKYFRNLDTKAKFAWLFIILFIYEVIEFYAIINFPDFFLPEPAVDIVWDIIIGMIGGLISFKVFNKR